MGQRQQAVSKPLLAILLIVAIVGAVVFFQRSGPPADENDIPGVPEVPADFNPPPPPPGEPSPRAG